jgi:hypothetical protein
MLEILVVIFAFCLWLIGGFILLHYALRLIYIYRLGKNGIEVYLFGIIPLFEMHFNNIEAIKKLTTKEVYRKYLVYIFRSYQNRFWGTFVSIRLKNALLFKNILITPNNADEFIAEAKKHLSTDTIVES